MKIYASGSVKEGKLFIRFRKDFDLQLARVKGDVEIIISKGKRTEKQNAALHKYFELVAEAMNDAGYSVQAVLQKKMEIEWNPRLIKEILWRPAQQVILGVKSTTELDKQGDIDKVYDHLNRHLSEKFFVHIPFPKKSIQEGAL